MSKRHLALGFAAILALSLVSIALAGPKSPSIAVSDSQTGLSSTTTSSGYSSHFTASGCGFKANDSNDYLVVRGPGVDTSQLTTWVDRFPVDGTGCGSASPSWSGSGVAGTFDVYVVRAPSGNAAQAQPLSNVVSIDVSNP